MKRKYEVVDWKSFMDGSYKRPKTLEIVANHVNRHKTVYRVAGIVITLVLAGDVITAFADSSNDAVAAFANGSPLDSKADAIYHDKLLGFGKWALIIRGGWASIHKALQEDFEGAKKSFFSYLVVYLILLAFPWAMRELDGVFA